MLHLDRELEEVVLIGEDIKIKVLSIKGNQVQLGLDVPKHVNVAREELLEK